MPGIERAAVDHIPHCRVTHQKDVRRLLNREQTLDLGDAEIEPLFFRTLSEAIGRRLESGTARNRGRKRNSVFHVIKGDYFINKSQH